MTLDEIKAARAQLPAEIVRTPILFSSDLAASLGCEVYLKAENLQVTGSYKVRAAFTILNDLTGEQKERGAAISSSGNFAGAFAFMGRLLDIPTTVVMMQKTAPFKIEKTRRYGSNVVLCENRFEARWETLQQLETEQGLACINTFEEPGVIAGHGTIGLEIIEDLAEVDAVVVPISSAGLLAGVATAIKETRPGVKIIGVQPEGSNATYLSYHDKRIQPIEKVSTICDALVATRPGTLPFEHVMRYVDDVVLVSDDSIKEAVRLLFETTKLVVEPSGAVGIAAIQSKTIKGEGSVAVLLSGGNVSAVQFSEMINLP